MALDAKADRQRRRLEATAYHEAGHFVMSLRHRRAARRLSIIPDASAGSLGRVESTPPPAYFRPDISNEKRVADWADREVEILLAGPIAESIFTGRFNREGASGDYATVADLAMRYYGAGVVPTKYVEFKEALVRQRLEVRVTWVQVTALAAALLEHKELSGRKARRVCILSATEGIGLPINLGAPSLR